MAADMKELEELRAQLAEKNAIIGIVTLYNTFLLVISSMKFGDIIRCSSRDPSSTHPTYLLSLSLHSLSCTASFDHTIIGTMKQKTKDFITKLQQGYNYNNS